MRYTSKRPQQTPVLLKYAYVGPGVVTNLPIFVDYFIKSVYLNAKRPAGSFCDAVSMVLRTCVAELIK